MALLPFPPQYSSAATRTPRVLKAKFGDGYEQRSKDGLNNITDDWNLTWNLNDADRDTLLAFFENLAGAGTFTWQSPDAAAVKTYVCDDWGYTPTTGNVNNLTAHIYQVFEP